MSTNFPASLDSYTTKVDGVDTVQAAHINNLQDAVVAVETMLLSAPAWTAPTLLNSWVNFGGSQSTAGYYLDTRTQIVHLRGLIKSGTGAAAAFTLPAGHRPPLNLIFPTVLNNGGADVAGHVDIDTSGNVKPNVTASVWFTLDGLSFRTS